jgi:predicted kinase
MKHIIILVGNIGSGKSTTAKKYVDEGYIVIARDALRYMIGAGNYIFNLEVETAIWNSELKILKEFMKLGVNIIVDEIGITKTERARYLPLIKKYKYKSTVLIMPKLSKKESVNRRMINPHGQPNRKLWEEVWKKFNIKYEEPSLAEGFNEIVKL